jgi:FHS family L-fucose permease-like MFS transporter
MKDTVMNRSNNKPGLITRGYVFTFALVTVLFFLWALPNTLNDVLIKQFMKSLELDLAQTGFLPFALKFGYFCLSIPAGLFMQRRGYKSGILFGLFLFAAGCFLFYPASTTRQYALFLGAIFIIAGGLAFLEIGANSFVVSLGDKSTSERRLNLAQSFNPIGGICGVTAGTLFIFSGNEPTAAEIEIMKMKGVYDEFLQAENLRVFPTYVVIGTVVLIVAALIWRTRFPKIETASAAGTNRSEKGSFRALFKYPHWYGAIISQFFYLGAQLGTWSYLITYVQQNSPLGEKQAGGFLIANMVLFMVGRFFSTWLMKYVKPLRLMGVYAVVNICLVAVAIFGSQWGEAQFGLGLHGLTLPVPFTGFSVPAGIYALLFTTFFMSLMYPTNFASGMKGLGPNAKLGASILVMSLIGGALLSLLMGRITGFGWADRAIAPAMIVPATAYVVIAWYAFIGSRPRGPVYE